MHKKLKIAFIFKMGMGHSTAWGTPASPEKDHATLSMLLVKVLVLSLPFCEKWFDNDNKVVFQRI